jgi:Leucine-rich repeat (LRR) protein
VIVGKSRLLFNNRLDDVGCSALCELLLSLQDLELLDLSYNHISDESSNALSRLVQVLEFCCFNIFV